MKNKIIELTKLIKSNLKSKQKLLNKIDNLKDDIHELAMTNDFLSKENEKNKQRYLDEHRIVLDMKKEKER